MTDTDNPVYQMINSIRDRIRKSLYDGDLDYEIAFRTLHHHLKIALDMDHQLLVGQLEEMMGTIEMEYGRFASAETHFKQSLDCFAGIEDQQRVLIMTSNLGEVYRRWGKADEAAACYKRARAIAQQLESTFHEAITFNNEGLLWTEFGEADRAMPLLEKALQLIRDLPLDLFAKIILSEIHNGMARNYLKQNNYSQAWKFARQALIYGEESNRITHMADAYLTMAQITMSDPNATDKPETFFQQSREHYLRVNANAQFAQMQLIEGQYWLQQDKQEQAIACFTKAAQHFAKAHLKEQAQTARQHIENLG